MNRHTKGFQYSQTILYNTIMVDVIIHLSKPIECTIPRADPKVKYGIRVKMTCHVVSKVVINASVSQGLLAYVGGGNMGEVSVPFSQFCCELKTALKGSLLKNKVNFKKEFSCLMERSVIIQRFKEMLGYIKPK